MDRILATTPHIPSDHGERFTPDNPDERAALRLTQNLGLPGLFGGDETAAEWITSLAIVRGHSQATKIEYAKGLALFAEWLAVRGLDWRLVKWHTLNSYAGWLRQHDDPKTGSPRIYKTATVKKRMAPVRNLYAAMALMEMIPAPIRDVNAVKDTADAEEIGDYDQTQVSRLFRSIESIMSDAERPLDHNRAIRDRALLGILVFAGLRCSEASSITIKNFTPERGQMILRVVGKGGKARTIPITPEVWSWIEEWRDLAGLEVTDTLFCSLERGGEMRAHANSRYAREDFGGGETRRFIKPLSARRVDGIVRERLDEASLIVRGAHSMRHTFATLMIEGGCPPHIVQMMLGHADPKMTLHYAANLDRLRHNPSRYITLDHKTGSTRPLEGELAAI
jgi:integrase/recombinase XerD